MAGLAVATRTAPAWGIEEQRAAIPFWAVLLVGGLITYYVWDLVIEGVASVWGLWSYTPFRRARDPKQPGATSRCSTPIIPFALMMALTLVVIDAKTRNGTPFVEWAAGVGRLTGGARTTCAWSRGSSP